MSYVRLVDVTKRFGDVTAVDHLNFEIEKGSFFSMLGPSGCGKTHLVNAVGLRVSVGRRPPALLTEEKSLSAA